MGLFERRSDADGEVIDLSERRRPKQRWGQPGRCPSCHGVGYLDHIDLIDRIMFQHCVDCSFRWETTQAELAESQ
jgi:hypothetical protein